MRFTATICLILTTLTGFSQPENDFVLTIQTDAPNTLDQSLFVIPTSGEGYNYNVDCNDDGVDEATGLTTEYTCDYTDLGGPGTYSIRIKDNSGLGTGFPRFLASKIDYNNNKIRSLDQWGTGQWTNMEKAFYKAWDMKVEATDAPNLSAVTDMSYMFSATKKANPDVSQWDVSNVTNLSHMFAGARAANPDVSGWDVSSVIDMSSMFWDTRITDPDVSNWDVSSVLNMSRMFHVARVADPDVSGWDVSSVNDMSDMFWRAKSADPDVTHWDVSSVTSMRRMFEGASQANPDVSNWDVSSVVDMTAIFSGATSANPNVSGWDVSSVQYMSYMFREAIAANPDVSGWDVSSATTMEVMFAHARSAHPDVSQWDVSSVTNMFRMFFRSPADPDVSQWDVSKVTNMQSMFGSAYTANPDVSHWDVSSVIDMTGMFSSTFSAKPNVSDWDVSSVTSMFLMFAGNFSDPDVKNWDVSSVTNMGFMFNYSGSANPDVSLWDVSSVTNMESMFEGAVSASPAIDQWDVTAVVNMADMFSESTLPPGLYDAILKGFSEQNLQSGVAFNAGNSFYCGAEAYRNSLISNFGWMIQDEGVKCGSDIAVELLPRTEAVTLGETTQQTLAVSNPGFEDISAASVITTFSNGHNNLRWTCQVISGAEDCPNTDGIGNLNEVINLAVGDELNYVFSFDLDLVNEPSAAAKATLNLLIEDIHLPNNDTFIFYDLNKISKFTSGSWFDPENPGHGLFLEVLEGQENSPDRINLYWFTYHNSEPVWFGGVGEMTDDERLLINVNMTQGANFPPDFLASDVLSEPWGTVRLDFESPQRLKLSWDATEFSEDFGLGEVQLTQLSTITASDKGCYSGSFYDPLQSGQGFYVHVTENSSTMDQLNIAWFTYDQGQLLWLIGSGVLNDNMVAELQLAQYSGASFFMPQAPNGWSFHATDLIEEDWGTLVVSFSDVNNLAASYEPNDTSHFELGALEFTRLTTVKGHSCAD